MLRIAARRSVSRDWRTVAGRAAIGVALVVITVLLWLLILTVWIDAATRAISPVSAISAAAALWS